MSNPCPHCGKKLSQVKRTYHHTDCPDSETGSCTWQVKVDPGVDECQLCPTCGEACVPTRIACPNCNKPIEDPGEN